MWKQQKRRRAAICQLDGNQLLNSDDGTTSETDLISEYESEEELDADPEPLVLVPEPGHPGLPPVL